MMNPARPGGCVDPAAGWEVRRHPAPRELVPVKGLLRAHKIKEVIHAPKEN